MKAGFRPLFLVATACLFVFVSALAGDKKDKVAIIHNGHIITVAPEAVPAHLAHGDKLVTNDVAITYVNATPSLGSVVGPSTVPSGGSATFTVSAFVFCSFDLTINGYSVAGGVMFPGDVFPYTYGPITDPLTVVVTFTDLGGGSGGSAN